MKEIAKALGTHEILFQENYPLATYSTFRVGGAARFFVRINSFRNLRILQKLILKENIPFFFLGGGSNLLISDQGFQGIIITLDIPENLAIKQKTESFIWVRGYANFRTSWFAKKISKLGYSNLEFMTTIPGQLGGALIQNAGCYGSEMKDVTAKIFACQKGLLKIFYPETAEFSYRGSIFKKNKNIWVYAADFKLPRGDTSIMEKIKEYQKHRIDSQPKNRKSAGSVFKNPGEKVSRLKAWQLIKKVGLNGHRIGGAKWSEEHSNFIINQKNASASDIYRLIKLAEEKVEKEENIRLEKEVVLVGNFSQ